MKVLVACEESQAVTIEFRKLGHEAYSCDLLDCSGGHPEWHIKNDVISLLQEKWDMMLAFPPCTYLSFVANRWLNVRRYGKRARERYKERERAMAFVFKLWNANIEKICIENPVGLINVRLRKPDQIIQPYYFGDRYRKRTCLWLKGLPKLVHIKREDFFQKRTHTIEPEPLGYIKNGKNKGRKIHWCEWLATTNIKDLALIRSKTFPGIAKAMAKQWGGNSN